MLPIGDQNEPAKGPPIVTLLFIAINLAVFFLIQLGNDAFTYAYSAIPAEITGGIDLVRPVPIDVGGEEVLIPQEPGPSPIYLTLLTSMFMHGGIAHIFGNMLFLWIFGDNVEHRVGHIPYLLFYLAAGIIASFAQIAIDPDSVIPTLGASGAISGVLGAYLVMFPTNRVTVMFGFRPVLVPAIVAIGIWAVFQFISGFGAIATTDETTGGVAYMAHVGGFIAGVIFGLVGRTIWGSGPRGTPATERRYGFSRP
ncbi:MAG: rhomboid family intramembrane serine protease [Chloroflexota bacterium]